MQKRSEVISAKESDTGIETLPELFGNLGDQVLRLLEAKLHLLKLEIKEDAANYVRGSIFFGFSAVVATVGFVFVNIALGFFLSTLFTFADGRLNYTFGFLCLGVFYLLVGAIVMAVTKSRLAAINPLPEKSLEEFRKDKQWLTKEL
jgi:uncharacterized membrane protein YqjE